MLVVTETSDKTSILDPYCRLHVRCFDLGSCGHFRISESLECGASLGYARSSYCRGL